MRFEEIIGLHHVKEQLRELVAANRLSHALLFLGKEGSGALAMAAAFCQYIVCERRNAPANAAAVSLFGEADEERPVLHDACGECPACQKAANFAHPDIHFSFPVVAKKPGDKTLSTEYGAEWRQFMQQNPYANVYDWLQLIKAENRQGNISAQECNDIIRKLSMKSFESEYKFLVLWMPEYLGNEGNKLLKLIEEPPANTLFILVAENDSQVLQTILSRTQLIRIPVPEDKEIADALLKRGGLSAERARQIALISEGNYREALQHLEHSEEDWQSMLRDWLNLIMMNKAISQVRWIDEMSKLGREKQKQFLRYCNHMLRQAIRIQLIPAGDLSTSAPESEFAIKINKKLSVDQIDAMIQEMDKAAYHVERNANAKILFHALTIKLYHIIADKSLILIT